MTNAAWDAPGDPVLRAVAADVRDEWRSEAEATIADAAAARGHQLTFLDSMRESMVRGDRLSIRCYNVRIAGTVCEVDHDLVSVRNLGAGRADLQVRDGLPIIVQVSDAAAVDGALAPLPSGGFRGRLQACESSGEEYSVWIAGESESQDGRIELGADTVRVISRLGAQIMVPTSAVLAVVPRL